MSRVHCPLSKATARRSNSVRPWAPCCTRTPSRAPASRQTRAAARSNGRPRERKMPERGLAARWSPRGRFIPTNIRSCRRPKRSQCSSPTPSRRSCPGHVHGRLDPKLPDRCCLQTWIGMPARYTKRETRQPPPGRTVGGACSGWPCSTQSPAQHSGGHGVLRSQAGPQAGAEFAAIPTEPATTLPPGGTVCLHLLWYSFAAAASRSVALLATSGAATPRRLPRELNGHLSASISGNS